MIEAVNPRIIIWARERRGLSVEELAAKVKREPSEINEWEAGSRTPAYTMLEELAYRHLKVTLAVFFFPEPPVLDDPATTFRRLPELEIERLSADTRDKIRVAQCYQDSLEELLGTQVPEPIHLRFAATARSLPRLANDVRSHLGVTLQKQFAFRQADSAFKAWRHAIEECGIFTFKDSFRDRYISGFCLLGG